MTRTAVLHLVWPLAGLGGLLSAACLASVWYINRLQDQLGESIRANAAELAAAQEMQIQLRQYRFHSLMAAADPTPARTDRLAADRARYETAVAALHRQPLPPDDRALLAAVERGFDRYDAGLGADQVRPATSGSIPDLLRWADEHPVQGLLAPCRELTERCQARMDATLAQSEAQSRLAGVGLFTVGLVGPLAGLGAGYLTARGWSRRVARLSVHVQAAQAHLDQDEAVSTMTLEPLRSPDDLAGLDRQLDRVVGRVKEVCERLQAREREILRAEQLAAVGQLAAGVAHEVRNPLTGIKMLVEAALRPADPTPLTREDLDLIRAEIGRLERTTQGLLDFARPPRPNRRPHDVRGLIAQAADLARGRAARQGVGLRTDLPPGPLVAHVDADQVAAAVTNLLVNALDATPRGGAVGVAARAAPGGMIEVDVTDTGPGIDPAVAGRLFTPFATTKPTGTGLGLSVARRTARDHGGDLTAAPGPGGGARFTLTLPPEVADAQTPGRG